MPRGGLVGLGRARDSATVMSVGGRRSFLSELAGSINQFSLSSSEATPRYFIDANVPMRSKGTKLKRQRRKSGLFV